MRGKEDERGRERMGVKKKEKKKKRKWYLLECDETMRSIGG